MSSSDRFLPAADSLKSCSFTDLQLSLQTLLQSKCHGQASVYERQIFNEFFARLTYALFQDTLGAGGRDLPQLNWLRARAERQFYRYGSGVAEDELTAVFEVFFRRLLNRWKKEPIVIEKTLLGYFVRSMGYELANASKRRAERAALEQDFDEYPVEGGSLGADSPEVVLSDLLENGIPAAGLTAAQQGALMAFIHHQRMGEKNAIQAAADTEGVSRGVLNTRLQRARAKVRAVYSSGGSEDAA